MDVKPGYKLTEVGVIPEEWRPTALGKEAQLLTGFPFPSLGFVASGVRLLRGSNVKRGNVDWSEAITEYWVNATPKIKKYELQDGDVVIAMDGALVGRSYATIASSDLPSLLVQRVARLRSHSTDQRLISAWIGSEQFVRHVDLVKTHTAIPHISLRDIQDFALAIPSDPAEQRAIAAALSDVDALLRGLDRLIVKKRDLKQAAMQQILTGRTRLPGFHEEWEVKRLEDIADIVSGGTPKTTEPSYWNGGIRWCTPTDITGCPGKYLTGTERTISALGLRSSGARLLPAGSLLLCSRATIGELKIASGEVCTNQGFKSLVCKPAVINEFVYYKLLTMKQALVGRAFGSTFLEISKANVAALNVSMPPHLEQTAIAAVLSDMDAELSTLETRRAKTRALKQAMMQALLTGRIRLVKPAPAQEMAC